MTRHEDEICENCGNGSLQGKQVKCLIKNVQRRAQETCNQWTDDLPEGLSKELKNRKLPGRRFVDIGDGKYVFDMLLRCLVNKASKKPIPPEEPLFILRGKDEEAEGTVNHYLDRVVATGNHTHANAAERRLMDFAQFKKDYPSRVKVPDTVVVKADEVETETSQTFTNFTAVVELSDYYGGERTKEDIVAVLTEVLEEDADVVVIEVKSVEMG